MNSFGFPLLDVVVMVGVLLLSLSLDIFGHKKGEEISLKSAVCWSVFWVVVALCYFSFMWFEYGSQYASLFLSGYVLEKSLSVDNLLVFLAIFSSFGIKSTHLQHKILVWGIIGAILFRAIFVSIGTALFDLHWSVEVLFGLVIAYSAIMIFKGGEDEEVDYSKHWATRLVGKFYPVANSIDSGKFFTLVNGVKMATPILLCAFVIEFSDVMFSFDSVPVVIGVSKEPLIVYAAMLFAILGLRALFFVLSVAMKYLCHLEKFVGVILLFVAFKLCYSPFAATLHSKFSLLPAEITASQSLVVVLSLLVLGVLASVIFPEKESEVLTS